MRVKFGSFTLDTGTRLLKQGDTPIALSPKAFDLLHHLVCHSPNVVGKRALLDTVWEGVVVTDASLTVTIREIRKALGDSGTTFIRTAHRRGYAFSGPVRVSGRPHSIEETALGWLVAGETRHALTAGENVIGRAKGLDVWIDHVSVSRLHARMIVHEGGATVEDLGSTNCTYVQGHRITTMSRVRHGDALAFGQAVFTLVLRSAAPSFGTERVIESMPRNANRNRP